MSRVKVEIKDHIAHVTLTREDKMNAVDGEMVKAIIEAGHGLIETDARAVVLTGAGPGFCAGLDVASFGALAGSNPEDAVMPRTHGPANDYQEVSLVWQKVPVPVIAGLHGVAFGAGLQIALGADIRIAAPDARFSIMEMKWGLIPDMGGMVLLPKLMRGDHLRRLTYTAQQIDAETALQYGLVSEVADDPIAAARDLAAEIAGKSPSAIRAAKRLILHAESGAGMEDVLHRESREQADLIGKPHQMEVIAANMGKRAPNFS